MSKTFLYHDSEPEGRIFDLAYVKENFEQLKSDGWKDTPDKLECKPVKKKNPDIRADQCEAMQPNEVAKFVENLGYLVFTPDRHKAELNLALKKASDAQLVAELKVRGLYNSEEKPSQNQIEKEKADHSDLMAQWLLDASKLSEKQLIDFGAELGLKLKRTMRMDTMRDKINSLLK